MATYTISKSSGWALTWGTSLSSHTINALIGDTINVEASATTWPTAGTAADYTVSIKNLQGQSDADRAQKGINFLPTGPANSVSSESKTYSFTSSTAQSTLGWFFINPPSRNIRVDSTTYGRFFKQNVRFIPTTGYLTAKEDRDAGMPLAVTFRAPAGADGVKFYWTITARGSTSTTNGFGATSGSFTASSSVATLVSTSTTNTSSIGTYTMNFFHESLYNSLGSSVATIDFEVKTPAALDTNIGFVGADGLGQILLAEGALTQGGIGMSSGSAGTIYWVVRNNDYSQAIGRTYSSTASRTFFATGLNTNLPNQLVAANYVPNPVATGSTETFTIYASDALGANAVQSNASYTAGVAETSINVLLDGTTIAKTGHTKTVFPNTSVSVSFAGYSSGSAFRVRFTPHAAGTGWAGPSYWVPSFGNTVTLSKGGGSGKGSTQQGKSLPSVGETYNYYIESSINSIDFRNSLQISTGNSFSIVGEANAEDPNTFALSGQFGDITDARLNLLLTTSNPVTFGGEDWGTESFTLTGNTTGVEYKIGSGDWISSTTGMIGLNDNIYLRRNSSSQHNTELSVSVSFQGQSKTWKVTTGGPQLTFSATPSTVNESGTISVSISAYNLLITNAAIQCNLTFGANTSADDFDSTVRLDGSPIAFSNPINFKVLDTHESYVSTLEFTLKQDALTEGTQSISFSLPAYPSAGTQTVGILDSSEAQPSLMIFTSVTNSSHTMNEGATSSLPFTITNYTESVIYWKATTNSSILNPVTGTVAVSEGAGTFTIFAINDANAQGDKTANVLFYASEEDMNSNGDTLAFLNITVLDTNIPGTISLSSLAGQYGIKIFNTDGAVLLSPNNSLLNYNGEVSGTVTLAVGATVDLICTDVTPTNFDEIGLLLTDTGNTSMPTTTTGAVINVAIGVTRGNGKFVLGNGGSIALTFRWTIIRY